MTNQEIATLTTNIVVILATGGNDPPNICRITSAYREIYATIKVVDQCEQLKGKPWDCKDHRNLIDKQLDLLVRTSELLFLEITNNPLNIAAIDALNKNIQTILSILSS
ncbi:hypothetical protein [Pelosinus sp. UFO1]|uniref:hypothetical protein n=1 Tax=Pelosinus sp. UFO1 TaxID=484770 RepID=UPI0004D11FD9|nr:hypothetical protein [Pelosinus sp. UFO1]AIF54138.1 hypothetical protein UFO1_4603 [Pelosinus sp. UFO1]